MRASPRSRAARTPATTAALVAHDRGHRRRAAWPSTRSCRAPGLAAEDGAASVVERLETGGHAFAWRPIGSCRRRSWSRICGARLLALVERISQGAAAGRRHPARGSARAAVRARASRTCSSWCWRICAQRQPADRARSAGAARPSPGALAGGSAGARRRWKRPTSKAGLKPPDAADACRGGKLPGRARREDDGAAGASESAGACRHADLPRRGAAGAEGGDPGARRRPRRAVALTVDVATFKDRYGVTRKFAIPLLEWLDRERVTRRVGDTRVVL